LSGARYELWWLITCSRIVFKMSNTCSFLRVPLFPQHNQQKQGCRNNWPCRFSVKSAFWWRKSSGWIPFTGNQEGGVSSKQAIFQVVFDYLILHQPSTQCLQHHSLSGSFSLTLTLFNGSSRLLFSILKVASSLL